MFVPFAYIAYIEYERQQREKEQYQSVETNVDKGEEIGAQNNKSHRHWQQEERQRLSRTLLRKELEKYRNQRGDENCRKEKSSWWLFKGLPPISIREASSLCVPFLDLPELATGGTQASSTLYCDEDNLSYYPTLRNNIMEREDSENGDAKNIPLSALESDTFRDDVRAEWIRAVFGTGFPQRCQEGTAETTPRASDSNRGVTQKNKSWRGVGLAGISSYVTYIADLEVPQISAPSKLTSERTNTKIENNQSEDRAKNESAREDSSLLLESLQPSLGMTLSRLSLGLYVRKVRPGSEAWCAGVEENSVLVGINDGELNLLAETSKTALERMWQYEGYCHAGMNTNEEKNANNRDNEGNKLRSSRSTASAKMKICYPISMTFIRGGRIYKVIFLGDPPYGIDWAPCGKFCLVQRVKTGSIADRAGVRPSSIIAGIAFGENVKSNKIKDEDIERYDDKNTIYYLDHSSVALILKEATSSCVRKPKSHNGHHQTTIRIQLCFPPSEARSGHWERRQDLLEEDLSNGGKTGGKDNARKESKRKMSVPQQNVPRPRLAAELDGVQVRIHPLLGGRGSLISNGRSSRNSFRRSRSPTNRHGNRQAFPGCFVSPSSPMSKLAERFAAGEDLSITKNSYQCSYQELNDSTSFPSTAAEYGRYYRPCPQLKNSSSSQIDTDLQQSSSNKLPSPSESSPSLLECWNAQQAFIYIFQYHLAGYNELEVRVRASTDTDLFLVLSNNLQESETNAKSRSRRKPTSPLDAFATFLVFWFGWLTAQDNKPHKLTAYLLKLVHQNQLSINKNRIRYGENYPSTSSFSIAHHMEFLAGAFDNSKIKTSLRKLRKKRQQKEHMNDDESKGSGTMLPLINVKTGLTPTHDNANVSKEKPLIGTPDETSVIAPVEVESSVKPRPKSVFRLFRKQKPRREKKKTRNISRAASVHTTIVTKEQSTPVNHNTLTSNNEEDLSPNHIGNDKLSPSPRSKSTTPSLANSKSSSITLEEFANSDPSEPTDFLFENMMRFLDELELICADIEKSLMKSFSQKFARWALQPWTASKESALANVTDTMRRRLGRCNQNNSSFPLLDPINSASEALFSIDTNGCYILPSAHFPLLLTFDCKGRRHGKNYVRNQSKETDATSTVFGEEYIYRTSVELVGLKGSRVAENAEKLVPRGFTVHGSVSGSVVESQQSIGLDPDSNDHKWREATNFMVFDSRSTWGPPQTLSIRLSETIMEVTDKGPDSTHGHVSKHKECGFCWVNLTPFWEQAMDNGEQQHPSKYTTTSSCKVQVVPFDTLKDFNEHGDLPGDSLPENVESIELELRIRTKILEAKSTFKRSFLYKHDDDVRQEMFAIEFIKSCDRILRSCGLDMKMLIYKCIPVGKRRGFMQWVQGSVPLSEICQPFAGSILANRNEKKKPKSIIIENDTEKFCDEKFEDDEDDNITLSSVAKAGMTKYESLSRLRTEGKSSQKEANATSNFVLSNNNNPIQDFLRSLAYDSDGSYKIKKEAMDTYIKSCAGYSVCTYILGVGDRHLDNLLLHESGHFFHCDYSFILGNDPKKYLPMRITQDMINGMGGWKSDNFCQFLSLACAAFLTLRRPENVRHLLSLIRLMEGCGLPDLENSQTIESAIQGVRDRLKLDLGDEEAITFMEKLIQDSCSSKMWIAVDAIHSLAKQF